MAVTKYIWDEQNFLAESDAADAVSVVYTNEPRGYGSLISSRIAGASCYHHFDVLGSTRQLTNASAVTIDTWIYDAWGNIVSRDGTTTVQLQWIGQSGYYLDTECGNHTVRRRRFDLQCGRWTSFDPKLFTDHMNVFIYAMNRPTLLIDPSGTKCQVCSFAVFQYGGSISDFNERFVGKPYSALALWAQISINQLVTRAVGGSAPLPTALGPGIVRSADGKTSAVGYFLFMISWPYCEPRIRDEPGACELWFSESGSVAGNEPNAPGVAFLSGWKNVSHQPFVRRAVRKKPLRVNKSTCVKNFIFADAPRASTVVRGSKTYGYTQTVEQLWEIRDSSTGDVVDSASHTLSYSVSDNLVVT